MTPALGGLRAASKSGVSPLLDIYLKPSTRLNLVSRSPVLSTTYLHGKSTGRRYESSSTHSVESTVKVEPPASTRPPPLEVRDRDPDEKLISYAFRVGKSYLSFYKTSLSAVRTNFFQTRRLLAEHDVRGDAASLAQAARDGILTRSGFHFVRRARADIAKVPLFALVLLICGEFTPLVVVFIPRVVPKACRIPKQVERERRKGEDRRAASFKALTEGPPDAEALQTKGIEALSVEQLLHVARSLGLYSQYWPDGLVSTPPLLAWLIKRRIGRQLEYLDLDDMLLTRDGGTGQMSSEEVNIALTERGLDTGGKKETDRKYSLKKWLRAREQSPILQQLLTRPSVWVTQGKS